MTVEIGARRLALGEELELPVDAVTRTIAVVGQKGTGKTSTAVVAVEEAAAAGARFAWMDPTGAASGLRSSADGEGPGLDCVVMGGYAGDVPLSADAGETVARLVVEEGYSVVCDLEKIPRSDQVRFVADFAEAALELCRSAVTVVFDEAPRFVPQGGAGIEEDGVRCRVAVTELVMLGRRKGLGSVLISQRPSKLHKDVLEQSDLLVSHRLMGNNDRKAIAGWLEAYDVASDWLERLPKLARGQAVVIAPEYELGGVFQIRPKRTFDSSATPEVGAVMLEGPRGRASIDLGELEAKMGHALAEAQENDPATLRRRIARLEEQLRDGSGADVAELEQTRRDLTDAEAALAEATARMERLEGLLTRTVGAIEAVSDAVGPMQSPLYGEIVEAVGPGRILDARAPHEVEGAGPIAVDPDAQARAVTDRVVAEIEDNPTAADGDPAFSIRSRTPDDRPAPDPQPDPGGADPTATPIKAGGKRMLAALVDAQRPLSRAELATLSKVRTGGTMSDYLSALRTRGLIRERDGAIELAVGVRALHELGVDGPRARSPEEVVAPHLGDLKAGARRMLDLLMRNRAEGLTRKELSGLAGIATGGTFSDYLSMLRRRGLIEERGRRVYPGSVLYLWEERR